MGGNAYILSIYSPIRRFADVGGQGRGMLNLSAYAKSKPSTFLDALSSRQRLIVTQHSCAYHRRHSQSFVL